MPSSCISVSPVGLTHLIGLVFGMSTTVHRMYSGCQLLLLCRGFVVGKRGGDSSGGSSRGRSGKNGGITRDDVESLINDPAGPATPEGAADALGLDGKDREHFIDGANAPIPDVKPKPAPGLPVPGKPESPGKQPGKQPGPDFVLAYERKYGRGAARAYSQGSFWSLLRAIRRVAATASTVTNPSNLPGNAALLAAYAFAKNGVLCG